MADKVRVQAPDGKRYKVPADKVAEVQALGWVVVDESAPAPENNEFSETAFDILNSGAAAFTGGLDDVAAGAGAWLGDAYQSSQDGRDRNPDAYAEGRDERRASVAASEKRSPTAALVGTVGGTLATAPLAALKAGKLLGGTTKAKVLGGALVGGLNSLGQGNAETLEDSAQDVAVGAALGGLGGGVPALLKKALSSGKSAVAPAFDAAKEAVAKNPGVVGLAAKGAGKLADSATGLPVSKLVGMLQKALSSSTKAVAPVVDDVVEAVAPVADDVAMSADDILSSRAALKAMEEAERLRRALR